MYEDSGQALMEVFDQQPVYIIIEADQSSFQMYKSGVLTNSCGSSLDHGKHVSYDIGSDNDYWMVRNSWCANTMARRHDLHHHGGVLYSDA